MRIRDRLIKGTVLNFVAVVFNQGSTLIVNIILARILMKNTFGEFAMVQSTLLTVATLAQLATGYTASKYIAEYRSTDPERASRIIGLCSIVSVFTAAVGTLLLLIIAPWLADSLLKASQLSPALMIGTGFLFFSAVNGYQVGALSGLESFGSLAKAGVVSGVTAVGIISFGASLGGLNGTLVGLSVSALVRCAIHNWWLRLEMRNHNLKACYRGSLQKEKSILFRFALPSAIAGFYSMPTVWLANSFLVRQPGGFGEMALYCAANNLRVLVLFLPNVMNSVGLSVLNNEKSNGDAVNYKNVFKYNVKYIFFSSLLAILIIGGFGRTILKIFGKDFEIGNLILWVLLVSSLFESVSSALYQYIQSKAQIWLSFFCITVPRDTFFIVAAYFLVKSYGGAGLALAFLSATGIGFICHLILVVLLFHKGKSRLDEK